MFNTLNLNRTCKFVKSTNLEVLIQPFPIFTQRHSGAFNSLHRVFNSHSKAFMCTQHCCAVQCSLKGIYVHSKAFRGVFTLTQMHSRTLNQHSSVFYCVQYSLKGGQPSKTQWMCAKNAKRTEALKICSKFQLDALQLPIAHQLYGFAKR